MMGMSFGSCSTPLVTIFICSAGIASATRKPPARRIDNPGRRMTRPVSAAQKCDCPAGLRRRPSRGMRPFSTRSPSQESMAGSTVSEANTAMATTTIAPSANEMNDLSPLMNMPAIATITVTPEISTARPEVAAAVSSAERSLRPAARSSRSRRR